MAKTKSKKQLILEQKNARGLERVGAPEIRAIQADLRRILGPDHKTSPSYIANVLREAGVRVDYDDRYVDVLIPEPYAQRLEGLLQFQNLDDAESALRKLDEIYQKYQSASDRVGINLVRSVVIKGRQRAESIAGNSRVRPEKRREKEEIARWFKVWLDISHLFFDWLEMRKKSEEFQQMFPKQDDGNNPTARES
ncbi:MAG TPA: DUF4385 family protein [Terriglobia bacterium]|nr:DUF4385 family protein [Terriglobia bacterium]